MVDKRWGTWLRRLRATATFVYIAALCLAVTLLVIAFIPGSPATLALPTSSLPGWEALGSVAPGIVADPAGAIDVRIADPSLLQRLIYLVATLPELLLAAEIARRMANLLRAAQDSDPFTAPTARALTVVAKIAGFGGAGVWAISVVAEWALSATVLDGAAIESQAPLGWLAIAFICAAFAQLVTHGVALRSELDTVI
jgi:hypothetical protein